LRIVNTDKMSPERADREDFEHERADKSESRSP
jgi:hypothetical protein